MQEAKKLAEELRGILKAKEKMQERKASSMQGMPQKHSHITKQQAYAFICFCGILSLWG
jgi:hypothetical protein